MEEEIQNYLPTVMFRGTPCTIHSRSLPLQSTVVNLTYSTLEMEGYLKLRLQIFKKSANFNNLIIMSDLD